MLKETFYYSHPTLNIAIKAYVKPAQHTPDTNWEVDEYWVTGGIERPFASYKLCTDALVKKLGSNYRHMRKLSREKYGVFKSLVTTEV